MSASIKIEVVCSEHNVNLAAMWHNDALRVDACPRCIQKAEERAEERGYDRGTLEGMGPRKTEPAF
jgi:hypothetical protein